MANNSLGYRTREEYLSSTIAVYDSDKCLLWPFSVDRDGYGRLTYRENGKKLKVAAHRLSFKIVNGHWPNPSGLHTCDTPQCFNPRHIFEGTDRDNHADQVSKGRTTKGVMQADAKLTDSDIINIRKEYSSGVISMKSIAQKYNVTPVAIRFAIRGKTWKHIGDSISTNDVPRFHMTHRIKGHELTADNCYIYGKTRQCKKCTAIRAKKRTKAALK